jgi:signal transduction histidine kinase
LRKAVAQSLVDLDKATTTVAALLRISEIENWSRRSAFKDVDVAVICAEVGDFYGPLAEARSITLAADVDGPLALHGDADLLREALMNLVDNAIKFTPKGGLVKIEAWKTSEGPAIRVTDNGPGIAPEEREKVLRRFYRSPAVRNIPGNGLGLSMVATIAELHGLDLRIGDNRPGAVIELVSGSEAALPSAITTPAAGTRFFRFGRIGQFFSGRKSSPTQFETGAEQSLTSGSPVRPSFDR